MLTEVTETVIKLCDASREYEQGGDPEALGSVLVAARLAHAALRAALNELTVPMAIRDELVSLDVHVLGLVRLLESMTLWPEISRATALMGYSMDLRTLNSAMRQLVESCSTARDVEELEVLLVATAALLYALRCAASRREELLTPSLDFSSLCAVSRAHLSVLAELALGELRVRSDARFALEQWRESVEGSAAERYGYSFSERRYAIRLDAARRDGVDPRTAARAAMHRHRNRSFEELEGARQIRQLVHASRSADSAAGVAVIAAAPGRGDAVAAA